VIQKTPLPLSPLAALTRKAAPWTVREADEQKMTLTADVSTEGRDRGGDVIMVDGWDLKAYRKNPVVLWAHEYWRAPIGKATVIGPAEEGGEKVLRSVTEFADAEFSREIFGLYKGGFMSAFSVGFRALEYEAEYEGDPTDGSKRFIGYRFLKQELLEFSAVPVPANPEALALAMKDGAFPAIRKSMERIEGLELTPAPADDAPSFEQARALLSLVKARFIISGLRPRLEDSK
jgi:HK97 family phage prohead protease